MLLLLASLALGLCLRAIWDSNPPLVTKLSWQDSHGNFLCLEVLCFRKLRNFEKLIPQMSHLFRLHDLSHVWLVKRRKLPKTLPQSPHLTPDGSCGHREDSCLCKLNFFTKVCPHFPQTCTDLVDSDTREEWGRRVLIWLTDSASRGSPALVSVLSVGLLLESWLLRALFATSCFLMELLVWRLCFRLCFTIAPASENTDSQRSQVWTSPCSLSSSLARFAVEVVLVDDRRVDVVCGC